MKTREGLGQSQQGHFHLLKPSYCLGPGQRWQLVSSCFLPLARWGFWPSGRNVFWVLRTALILHLVAGAWRGSAWELSDAHVLVSLSAFPSCVGSYLLLWTTALACKLRDGHLCCSDVSDRLKIHPFTDLSVPDCAMFICLPGQRISV